MRQSMRDRRTYMIIGLSVFVMFMAVGFAVFRTSLNITGTASITANWCVGFDNTTDGSQSSCGGLRCNVY